MEKNIANAFTYMFNDPDWKYKYGVIALLSIPMGYYNLVSGTNAASTSNLWLLLVAILVGFFVTGFGVQCTYNVIFANPENPTLLPAWEENFGSFFWLGLKKIIAGIIAAIVVAISAILVIPLIIFLFISIALERNFCTEQKLSSYLAWGKAFKLIGQNPGKYILIALAMTGIGIAIMILLTIIIMATMKTMPIVTLLLNAIITPYLILVQAYLIGLIGEDNSAIYD